MRSCSTSQSGARLSLSMRRYRSCRAELMLGCGTLAMGISGNESCIHGFYGLQPYDGLSELLAQRLAFRIGERRLARLADRRRLLAQVRGRRVLHQRVEDGEEVALAATVRLAVALDEPRALGDLAGERDVALRRLGDMGEPALDQLLLLAVAIAHRPPRPQPGERAHEEIAEEARGLDVHAHVVCVELAPALSPGNKPLSQETRKNRGALLDSRLELVDHNDRLAPP